MNNSPSIINVGDMGAPLSKFIETIGSAVGVIYEPTRIIRKAKAEVVAAKIKAEGDAELRELAARAEERLRHIELRRQRNIEAIVKEATKALPETVSDEKVDEDWTAFFFENCKDVTNEQMQLLWAKVLAGEVAQPGSYSLRTLQTIRLMREYEAKWISLFGTLTVLPPAGLNLFYMTEYTNELLGFPELENLCSIGLLTKMPDSKFLSNGESISLSYFDTTFTLFNYAEGRRLSFHYIATLTGLEILSLSNSEPDEKYLESLFSDWRDSGLLISPYDEILRCTSCERLVKGGDIYCGYCGTAVKAQDESEAS